ncbi:MAG: VOC family protein [Bacteroidota bacterium]
MALFNGVHHIAIICSDYQVSKRFYHELLGLEIIREVYREERDSWKLDLAINGTYVIELFSFPDPPARPSQPEAAGLRHLAFSVSDLHATVDRLIQAGIQPEPVRMDSHTGKAFTFFSDPDGLPLELYQS